jgi:hypothetical protein
MGLLWTTEGTRRIKNTLNTAFDGPTPANKPLMGLDLIRQGVYATPKLLAKVRSRKWKAGHLARALQLLPYDQSAAKNQIDPKDIKRWHYFLKNVVGSSSTFAPIQNALADAILYQDPGGNPAIRRVSFDHVELPVLDPNNPPNPNVVIFDAPLTGTGVGGDLVRHITLFTVEVDKNQGGSDFDPSDGDDLPTPPWETSNPPP